MKNNKVIETILTRRSCRSYLKRKVSDSDIQTILDCGLSAPSGMNSQPWFVVALKNKEIMNALNNNARENFAKSGISWRINWAKEKSFNFFYDSPVLFLIFGDAGSKSQYTFTDCGIVAENISIASESLGLASCIIGDVTMIDKEIFNNIKVPKNYEIILGVSVGYARRPKKTLRKISDKKFCIID